MHAQRNLILEAVINTNHHDFSDPCLSNAIESEATLLANLCFDDADQLYI